MKFYTDELFLFSLVQQCFIFDTVGGTVAKYNRHLWED